MKDDERCHDIHLTGISQVIQGQTPLLNMTTAIIVRNLDGNIRLWNRGAEGFVYLSMIKAMPQTIGIS